MGVRGSRPTGVELERVRLARNKLNYGVLSKCPLSRVRVSSPLPPRIALADSCAQRAAAATRPARARPASEAPVLLAAPVGEAVAALAAELRPVESEEAALRATVPVGAELEPVLDALRREEARSWAEERPAVDPPLAQLSEGSQKTNAVSAGQAKGGRQESGHRNSRVVEGDAVLLEIANALERVQAVVAGVQLRGGRRVGADALFGG